MLRKLTNHSVSCWLALVVYLAAILVAPASAVYCQQGDGDIAILWGGGCVQEVSCCNSSHDDFYPQPQFGDTPCVDTPITPDVANLLRRTLSGDNVNTVNSFEVNVMTVQVMMPLKRVAFEVNRAMPPPSLPLVRSVVWLI